MANRTDSTGLWGLNDTLPRAFTARSMAPTRPLMFTSRTDTPVLTRIADILPWGTVFLREGHLYWRINAQTHAKPFMISSPPTHP